jgi:hypothetical protein
MRPICAFLITQFECVNIMQIPHGAFIFSLLLSYEFILKVKEKDKERETGWGKRIKEFFFKKTLEDKNFNSIFIFLL